MAQNVGKNLMGLKYRLVIIDTSHKIDGWDAQNQSIAKTCKKLLTCSSRSIARLQAEFSFLYRT